MNRAHRPRSEALRRQGMNAILPASTRRRLAKLLGLLGSEHIGERDAAGLAAHHLMLQCGLTWEDLLAPTPVKREPLFGKWRTTCAELAKRQDKMRPWERKFVADLAAFPRISTKQRYVLEEIAGRVLGGDSK